MKANEAPEKLYFGEVDKGVLDIYSNKESDGEIEYTRTDVFIEKACKWLKENVLFTHPRKGTKVCAVNLAAFVDAMKGE